MRCALPNLFLTAGAGAAGDGSSLSSSSGCCSCLAAAFGAAPAALPVTRALRPAALNVIFSGAACCVSAQSADLDERSEKRTLLGSRRTRRGRSGFRLGDVRDRVVEQTLAEHASRRCARATTLFLLRETAFRHGFSARGCDSTRTGFGLLSGAAEETTAFGGGALSGSSASAAPALKKSFSASTRLKLVPCDTLDTDALHVQSAKCSVLRGRVSTQARSSAAQI